MEYDTEINRNKQINLIYKKKPNTPLIKYFTKR